MELIITAKGNKYSVQDRKNRLLYTVKKKGLGMTRFVLLDASNYHLYSIIQDGDERKPSFHLTHNDNLLMTLMCRSLFLDPTIIVENKEIHYQIASKDRKNFEIIMDGEVKGTIKTLFTASGDFQYELEIDNKVFDDYLVLFVVAVDRTFSEINKSN